MRVKEYTIEKLNSLPLSFVRNLDVQTPEEEIILQAVVNEKMKTEPIETLPQLTLEEQRQLDSPRLTPEMEREIQNKLDARRAKYRAIVTGNKIPSIEGLEVEGDVPVEVPPSEVPSEVPTATEPTPEESAPEIPIEPRPEAVARFCEYCTAKAVKHLKICNRPK